MAENKIGTIRELSGVGNKGKWAYTDPVTKKETIFSSKAEADKYLDFLNKTATAKPLDINPFQLATQITPPKPVNTQQTITDATKNPSAPNIPTRGEAIVKGVKDTFSKASDKVSTAITGTKDTLHNAVQNSGVNSYYGDAIQAAQDKVSSVKTPEAMSAQERWDTTTTDASFIKPDTVSSISEGIPTEQNIDPQMSHRQRAVESQKQLYSESNQDTAKTDEMKRTEYFQRLADKLNNQTYYKPDIFVGKRTGSFVSEGGHYKFEPREFEDARQQVINRARQGDKLAYQELGRWKEANDVLYKLFGQGEMNHTDLESLRLQNIETLRQLVGVSKVDLMAEMRRYDSDIDAKNFLRMSAANLDVSTDKVALLFDVAKTNHRAASALAGMLGLTVEGFLDALKGDFSESMLSGLGKDSEGAIRGTTINQRRTPYGVK